MSKNQVLAAETLLRDHFGETVAKVGYVLLTEGWTPLQILISRLKLPTSQIKQCVQLLLQHNVANFHVNQKGLVEFCCDAQSVLILARFPWFLHTAKSLFGNLGELLIEEILSNGQLSAPDCIKRVFAVSKPLGLCQSVEELEKVFHSLAETQFIKRCPNVEGENEASNPILMTPIFVEYKNPFLVPDKLDINTEEKQENTSKKRKAEDETAVDILWRVNFNKIQLYLRDQAILQFIDSTYGDVPIDVFRAFLRLNEVRSDPYALCSQPLSVNEAAKYVPDSSNLVPVQIQQYATCITEDLSRMLKKVGESAGGQFIVDFTSASKKMAEICVENLVREKFGSKALRIFRLLLMKGYLEQNQLESFAMLPNKEAKDITYRLISEGFISLKEVPKTSDFAPSRTFYLCYVNLPQIVRKLTDLSYKTMHNLISRRDYEIDQNKALLDRQERLDSVIENIQADENMDGETKQQHIRAVEEAYISLAEKEILSKHKRLVSRIQQAEIEVDQYLFLLETYLKHIPKFATAQSRRGGRK
uniref:DNA-directed RNA polymerase III subunit RPC3 n=1 Tax=Romanomermis culicivorax TaxID=13658 RepID=A0A915KVD4_ROMCU